ncbi:MAG: RNA-binding transcriptional accessory protein, partial [Clostridia bacterium]|nr:RNA-binding transcriptional accessory protein [Clostridia bacterium]
MDSITLALAAELGKPEQLVRNVIDLLDEGNTIPFIARYRKEAHGAMDDTTLRNLEERLKYLRNLSDRKAEVTKSIETQGKLTEELSAAIESASTLAELEDIYRPYKPKRRTRATIAREKGLEPLAEIIFAQEKNIEEPGALAGAYVDPEKGVNNVEEALAGASDIIAEQLSDSAEIRKHLKIFIHRNGKLSSVASKDEDSVYDTYYGFSSPVSKIQGHQILALNRGEKEDFLKVSLELDRNSALELMESNALKKGTKAEDFIRAAIADSYDRLLFPSIENEIRAELSDEAAEGAIRNFALNLRPLLMQPPVRGKVTMGLDPGYR